MFSLPRPIVTRRKRQQREIDKVTTAFALPNFQGNTAMNWGQGPGLSEYFLGQSSGTEAVTLLDQTLQEEKETDVLLTRLAEARVNIVTFSTYDTDYLLVPTVRLSEALDTLTAALVKRYPDYGMAIAAIVFTLVHMALDGVHFGFVQEAIDWNDPLDPRTVTK